LKIIPHAKGRVLLGGIREMKNDMRKLFNYYPVITGFSGRMGNCVYYMRGSVPCARTWVVPANPRTELQQAGRARFAGAVRRWRALDDINRVEWKERAAKAGRTGYNLFISEQMRHCETAAPPEIPSLKPAHHMIHAAAASVPPPITAANTLSHQYICREWAASPPTCVSRMPCDVAVQVNNSFVREALFNKHPSMIETLIPACAGMTACGIKMQFTRSY